MNTPSRSRLLRLTIASILTSAAITSQTALAADLQETVSVSPEHTVSPTEERMMSRTAARVLRHIVDARSAINAKDLGEAKYDMERARTLIDLLKSEQPTAKVRDHIRVAKQHLDYESTEEVTEDLVPIEADLTEIETFVPVATARKHTRFARERLKKGDKAGAKKELEAANAALIYTEVDLPLDTTERQVIIAQKALDNNQPAQADKALDQAEQGVQFLSTAVEAPITQARNSIWQATKDYADKDYAAAKADLAGAGVWLDKAAQSTDKTTRVETTHLKRELEGLQGKIEQKGEQTHASLHHLWQRSQALAEREAETASADWATLRTDSSTKIDLIDAKLHLAYAESDQFMQGKSNEAADELDKARADLELAAKTSNKDLAEKIHALRKQLAQIKDHLDDQGAEAHSRYEIMKAKLRQTIHDI